MGLGREGIISFVSLVGALTAGQVVLLWASQRITRTLSPNALRRRRARWIALAAIVSVLLGERVTYAVAESRSAGTVLEQASSFPLYFPITARKLLLEIGVGTARGDEIPDLDPGSPALAYPREALRLAPPESPLNVVWLVAESLRPDVVEPEIMPALHHFSRGAWRFTQHYSGGNGTRMGMFSMFYGVHGPYWFQFLAERRSPVLLDVLQQQGYQLGLFTSARFSYPEFDRTIFARVPAEAMRDSASNYHATDWERGWRNDRERVSELIEFLDTRDRARPFFAFMFFESTHFRYYFPDESVIRRPYAKELDLEHLTGPWQASLRYARYVNAAHHLDSQIARILGALRSDEELANTIVLITGDHGEEFLEKGRLGHNSEFHEEQVRVPLVLWIPGDGAHEVDTMTSHVDIPPTILPLLGVSNPPEDYSLGRDLRGAGLREWTVVADWSRLGIVDRSFKLTIPIQGGGLLRSNAITTWDDQPLSRADVAGAWRSVEPKLRLAIEDLDRFRSGSELRMVSRPAGGLGSATPDDEGPEDERVRSRAAPRRGPGSNADRSRRFRGRPTAHA
jgi:membrane-anchored protein YejM (alkaline phosphatase superfamily)